MILVACHDVPLSYLPFLIRLCHEVLVKNAATNAFSLIFCCCAQFVCYA